ncbi:hypothetical protein HDU96_009433 [Phlyctochytrium bullatum]|nr:hypothetical protein HDU96_009433 [Phlyctochytrium bullatum]
MSIVLSNRIASLAAPALVAVLFPVLATASALLGYLRPKGPSFDAKGKVIIITGASSGIGEALAEQYASEGGILVLVARRREELARVAEKCRNLKAQTVIVEVVDVAEEAQMKNVVQRIGERFGRIDMIVLNAGISMGSDLSTLQDTTILRRIMDVNYIGAAAGALYAIPYLRKSATRGKIVVVSSLLGIVGGPHRTGYSASKFALKGFFDALRLEEPTIDVTMVYPGIVATDINKSRLGSDAKDLDMRGAMSATDAAKIIVSAVRRGSKDEVYTLAGKAAWYFKDLLPSLRDYLMNRAIRAASLKREKTN